MFLNIWDKVLELKHALRFLNFFNFTPEWYLFFFSIDADLVNPSIFILTLILVDFLWGLTLIYGKRIVVSEESCIWFMKWDLYLRYPSKVKISLVMVWKLRCSVFLILIIVRFWKRYWFSCCFFFFLLVRYCWLPSILRLIPWWHVIAIFFSNHIISSPS